MRGVAVTYPLTTDKELERWHALGTRGARVNVLYDNAHSTGDIDSLLDKVSHLAGMCRCFLICCDFRIW